MFDIHKGELWIVLLFGFYHNFYLCTLTSDKRRCFLNDDVFSSCFGLKVNESSFDARTVFAGIPHQEK